MVKYLHVRPAQMVKNMRTNSTTLQRTQLALMLQPTMEIMSALAAISRLINTAQYGWAAKEFVASRLERGE